MTATASFSKFVFDPDDEAPRRRGRLDGDRSTGLAGVSVLDDVRTHLADREAALHEIAPPFMDGP